MRGGWKQNSFIARRGKNSFSVKSFLVSNLRDGGKYEYSQSSFFTICIVITQLYVKRTHMFSFI